MTFEMIGLLVVVGILAIGALYTFKGSEVSDRWRAWITKACLAAAIALGVGTLTLGLPGRHSCSLSASSFHPTAPWPLAIMITQAGALSIMPVSLALRFAAPHLAGWQHVWATAFVTFVATLLVAIVMANQALRLGSFPPPRQI